MIDALLEGYMSGLQLKRQRDQDLADQAIAAANQKFRQEDLDLRKRNQTSLEADRKADNLRKTYEMITPFVQQGFSGEQVQPMFQDILRHLGTPDDQMPQFSFPTSPKLTQQKELKEADLAQKYRLAQERFANTNNAAKRKAIVDTVRTRVQAGKSPAEALMQAVDEADALDIILQGAQTGDITQRLEERGDTFAPIVGALGKTLLGQEPTPRAIQQQAESQAIVSQRTAQTGLIKDRAQREKELFPIKKASAEVSKDLNQARIALVKEQTQTQKLINRFTPEQLRQKIAQGEAMVGQTQARTLQIQEQVKQLQENRRLATKTGGYVTPQGTIKANPTDPRSPQAGNAQVRSALERARTNYRTTTKELGEQDMILRSLRTKILNAEDGIFDPDTVKQMPTDPMQANAYKNNYLTNLRIMAGKVQSTVNELTTLAENQKQSLMNLEADQKRFSQEEGKAVNRTITSPVKKPGSTQPTRKPGTRPNTYTEPKRTLKPAPSQKAKPRQAKPAGKPMTDEERKAALRKKYGL